MDTNLDIETTNNNTVMNKENQIQDQLLDCIKRCHGLNDLEQEFKRKGIMNQELNHPKLDKKISIQTLLVAIKETSQDEQHNLLDPRQDYKMLLRDDVLHELNRIVEQ